MALTVTRSRIKERCAVSDSAYDSAIDNIISDYVPVIEFAVRNEFLVDVSNAGLQATLNLAALEICCGEFLGQRMREPGTAEKISVEGLSVEPVLQKSFRDPSGLVLVGWTRLRPYLKSDIGFGPMARVLSGLKESFE